MYQKIKGTNDFFEDAILKRRYIESIAKRICKSYNIGEMVTPIFEATEVFVRSSGEGSDVVNKEMYTFKDKGDKSITLRPEGTASIVRSFLENKLYAQAGLKKYFYYGPMFRYERPQKGRYREFNQFGVEYFGDSSYFLDADIIMLASLIFNELGLSCKYRVCINTIGDFESRNNYQKALKEYFSKHIDKLCDDCKNRLNKNPMRILDCKVDKDSDILKNAPKIKDYLNEESVEYFKNLCNILDNLGIDYYVDANLVRGLDYYTDTVFEFIVSDITNGKEENALKGIAMGGGGKYADLVKNFGGPEIPGIGFAFGVERIIELMDYFDLYPEDIKNKVDITLITLDNESKIYGLKLEKELRLKGIVVEMDYVSNSMKPQFKLSERNNSKFVGIIGEEERNNGIITVKNTLDRTQENVKIEDLVKYIRGE